MHRARVVLSLVGVFLAVFAMTVVTAAGQMGRQAVLESAERGGGRTATLSVSISSPDGTPDPAMLERASAAAVERFGVRYHSVVTQSQTELSASPDQPAQPPGSGPSLQVVAVGPVYGTIHRISPAQGRWFAPGDERALAPVLVVNAAFLEQTGLPPRVALPFAARIGGSGTTPPVTATVVGVVDRDPWSPEAMMLTQGLDALPAEVRAQGYTQLELWVPPASAEAITKAVPSVLAVVGASGDASVTSDQQVGKILGCLQWGVRAVSIAALALASLSVLNVGVVTVRQRVREIGVRRAPGASSSRVFAAIMLESVVATSAAGVLGVALAVAIAVNLPLDVLAERAGISDVPPFPARAAVEALVAATVVGALVGLVPATMAVRARVIDAIRYRAAFPTPAARRNTCGFRGPTSHLTAKPAGIAVGRVGEGATGRGRPW